MSNLKKKLIFYPSYVIGITLFVVSACEILARVTGHQPWIASPVEVRIEPGGSFYKPHPTLGYSPLPGQFKVSLNDTYTFKATNLDNGLRVTHPLDTYSPVAARSEIWILGDSVTYGWAVNDEETFSWLLQSDLPNYEIVNFGVMGYGTLQGLIQLRDAIQHRKAPRLVIVNYASWHDVRNTLIRGRRKVLSPAASMGPLNQPYARLTGDGKLEIVRGALQYREFPLMRYSALSNLLEETYDNYEARHADTQKVTKAIIGEIAKLCRDHGIEVIVAALSSDPTTSDMLAYCQTEGLETMSMFVDLRIKENNNLPLDVHPSAHAHQQYAQLLIPYLRNVLHEPKSKFLDSSAGQ